MTTPFPGGRKRVPCPSGRICSSSTRDGAELVGDVVPEPHAPSNRAAASETIVRLGEALLGERRISSTPSHLGPAVGWTSEPEGQQQ
jgi:hypothetical protein